MIPAAALMPRTPVADLCLIALRLAGWLATTGLATLGCFVLAFLVLGGFSAEGALVQLDNMTGRFAAADAARRTAFLGQLAIVAAGLFAVLAICRRRLVIEVFTLESDPPHV